MKKIEMKILFLFVALLTLSSTLIALSMPIDGPVDPPSPSWEDFSYYGCISQYKSSSTSASAESIYYNRNNIMLDAFCGYSTGWAEAGVILRYGLVLDEDTDVTVKVTYFVKGRMTLAGTEYNKLDFKGEFDDSTPNIILNRLTNVDDTFNEYITVEYTFQDIGSGTHYFYLDLQAFVDGPAGVRFLDFDGYSYISIHNIYYHI